MGGLIAPMIERYDIRERIGAGGLADVFAARDSELDREVALKMLREPDRDDAHVRRFLREGRLLSALRHKRLPRCHEVIELPRPTLVLERLQGASLSQRIRSGGRLRPDRVEEIAGALLDVLAFLHANGIVHRDVKAGNIYLERDGRILLMDLGLAVDPTDVLTTTLGDVVGTYAYMAPEQIAGAEVDHRCDLYSLGVTLYEALAGRRPFRAEGASGYLEAHLKASPRPLKELAPTGTPSRLIHLIERLMARDPADRPYSARVALALLTGQSLHDELRGPPLVGRSGVLGSLEAVLDAGGVVHIVGEPGMGLGRCARLAWTQARGRGVEVLSLRCGRVRDEAGLWESLSAALRPTLGRVRPREESVRAALSGLVGESPPLLMVEDVDALPRAAMDRLAALIQDTGVPAVTTSSGDAPSLPGHVITLRPISIDETRALIQGMLATRAAPPELVRGLHVFTGGLPAVLVYTVRDLHRRGALRWLGLDADGRQIWQLARTEWVTRVHPMRRGYSALLGELGEDERTLLQVLAVVDEPLPLAIALAAAGLDEGSTAPFRLARRRIVEELEREAPEGMNFGGMSGRPITSDWISLSRPVVGALTRVEMDEERTRTLHGALASALQDAPRGAWRDERLPYHQALGVPAEQASKALVGLVDWLVRQQRYQRAMSVLERLEQCCQVLDPLTSTHRALARAACLAALGRAGEAQESLTAARRLADELVRPDLAAAASVTRGNLQARFGSAGRALELAEEALTSSSDSVHDPMMPAAMVLRAEALRLSGHGGAATETFRNAMDVALIQGRMDLAARAQVGLARLASAAGSVEQAGHDLEGAAELMRGVGDRDGLLECYYELAELHRRRGQVAQALEMADRSQAVAGEAQLPRGMAWGAVARAGVFLDCGDLAAAARLLRAQHISPSVEVDRLLSMAWMETLAELRLARGDRPAALAVHQRALLEAEAAGWFVHRAFHGGMVAILTAQGIELSESLSQLYEADDRRRAARLLLEGARMTADVEILGEALEEIRALDDHVLLLRALHLTGGEEAREEIRALADAMRTGAPASLRDSIEALAAVSWAR